MGPLLDALRTKDKEKVIEWAASENWATVDQLISATTANSSHLPQGAAFGSGSRLSSSSSAGGIDVTSGTMGNQPMNQPLWTCPHCTFLNPAELATCEMCNLPR